MTHPHVTCNEAKSLAAAGKLAAAAAGVTTQRQPTVSVVIFLATTLLSSLCFADAAGGAGEASSCGRPMNGTALGGRNLEKGSFLDPTHNVTLCCLACDRTVGCVGWTGEHAQKMTLHSSELLTKDSSSMVPLKIHMRVLGIEQYC
jgi:hypothetical protein